MYARNAALLSVVALMLCAGIVLGQDAPAERKYVEPTEADIAIGDQLFFRIRTPAAGFRVVERERIINERLVDIISDGNPAPVTISPIRGKPTIYVDGVQLVTVYPRDVEANGAGCMMQLAKIWAKRIADGLPQVWKGCKYGSAAQAATAEASVPAAEGSAPDVPEATRGK
jgi:hypothetical protein